MLELKRFGNGSARTPLLPVDAQEEMKLRHKRKEMPFPFLL
jgi:hypothetical protein